jgi:hypothetical protein
MNSIVSKAVSKNPGATHRQKSPSVRLKLVSACSRNGALIWYDTAWTDYLYWQARTKKILKRIYQLIKDIERNGNTGIGKPETLKGNLSGLPI